MNIGEANIIADKVEAIRRVDRQLAGFVDIMDHTTVYLTYEQLGTAHRMEMDKSDIEPIIERLKAEIHDMVTELEEDKG